MKIDKAIERLLSSKKFPKDKQISKRDMPAVEELENSIWNRLLTTIKKQKTTKIIYKIQISFKYAAVFFILLTVAFYVFEDKDEILQNDVVTDDAITIELGDGTVRALDTKGSIHVDSEGIFLSIDDNKLSYHNSQNHGGNESSKKEVVFHSLKVPKGKKIQLVLSDNSRVYLNSGSLLKYPAKFTTDVRSVYLEGEAYFKVAKAKAPFIVKTNDFNTQVFGTEFNVSAYKNDAESYVVLVKGSLGVFDRGSRFNPSINPYMEPNQKISSKNINEVFDINIEDYVSWRDNILVFKNERFGDILKKLERHFGILIVNNNENLSEERFTGKFEEKSIETILEVFKKASSFEYEGFEDRMTIN